MSVVYGHGVSARDDHDPRAIANFVLMFTDNFTKAPPNAIAHYRRPKRARGDEAGAKASFICWKKAQQEQTAAFNAATLSYVLELRGARQTPGPSESQ